MARGEIKIPMAVNTSGIAREINNGLVEPLEDAEDALKSLERVDAGKDLEKDLGRASMASEELKDEIDDTADKLRKLGFRAKDAGDDAKKGMNSAEDGVKEFGEEANSTAKEAAASFDGSAESIGDAFQEVAANAFAGFGPAGALAGLALAAGIGIGMQKITEATEAVEELQERASEIHLAALEEGVDVEEYTTGIDYITEALERLNEEGQKTPRWYWEEDQTGLQEFVSDLRRMGETQADVTDIMALSSREMGDYRDEIEKARTSLQKEEDALRSRADAGEMLTEAEYDRLTVIDEIQGAQERVIKTLETDIETRSEAAERSSAWADSGAADAARRAEAEQEAADAIADAQQTVQDSVLSAYDSMRNAATEYATTEEGALDIGRWLEYTQQHAEQVATYRTNLESMKLTPEQWANLMEMPEATRAQWVAQFVALPEEARAPYSSALNDLGSDGGNQAAVGFEDSFDPDANVKIKVDDARATADIRALTKPRTVDVRVKTTGQAGVRGDLESLTRERTARVNVQLDLWNAQRQFDNFMRANDGRILTIYGRYIPPRIGRGYM